MSDVQSLIDKIRTLPPERLGEVENFVDFIASKTRRMEALLRLLAIAPALETTGVAPPTEDEIMTEVKAGRADRHKRRAVADRS